MLNKTHNITGAPGAAGVRQAVESPETMSTVSPCLWRGRGWRHPESGAAVVDIVRRGCLLLHRHVLHLWHVRVFAV
jgi:hypothetical protein